MVVNEQSGGAIGNTGIALTFGLAVMAMALSFGNVSGAHLNPAVSLALAWAGRFPWRSVLPYGLAQICGALAASGLLRLLFPDNENLGATLPSGPVLQSFVLEVVLAGILMLTILHTSTGLWEKGGWAALAVGSVVALEALFAGPVSGASMNPARSLAPALVSGQTTHLWVYLTAPFLGALAAVPLCLGVHGEACCPGRISSSSSSHPHCP